MGKQTSRILWQNQDHKEMVTYINNKPQYHDSAWIWKNNKFELVWKKLYSAMADPIIGLMFHDDFIPYKLGDYYVGNIGTQWVYGDIGKIHKDTLEETTLLQSSVSNKIQFGAVARDGRIIALRNNLYVIDVDSADILLSRPIEVRGDSYNYKINYDYYATLHHKYMYSYNGLTYRYESPTSGRERKNYVDITTVFLPPLSIVNGYGSLCNRIQSISMGSYLQTQYGIRFADTSPYTATFVEMVAWGEDYDYRVEVLDEKSFPFDTNGGMTHYMDNDHLIIAEHVWNPTIYYVVDIPSLEYFEVDVSEIADADNYGELTVSPSGNTIIYQRTLPEPDNTYKYYKKDKDDAHWEELLCSDSNYSYNYSSNYPSFDLVDDSVFFMKRRITVASNIYEVYQAYKLRQATE